MPSKSHLSREKSVTRAVSAQANRRPSIDSLHMSGRTAVCKGGFRRSPTKAASVGERAAGGLGRRGLLLEAQRAVLELADVTLKPPLVGLAGERPSHPSGPPREVAQP